MTSVPAMTSAAAGQRLRECRACAYFCNDPAYLERELPGLASLGSAHASVRGDDGLCARHDRYLGAGASCADFLAAVATSTNFSRAEHR